MALLVLFATATGAGIIAADLGLGSGERLRWLWLWRLLSLSIGSGGCHTRSHRMFEGQFLPLCFLAAALLDQRGFVLTLDLYMTEKLHHLILEASE